MEVVMTQEEYLENMKKNLDSSLSIPKDRNYIYHGATECYLNEERMKISSRVLQSAFNNCKIYSQFRHNKKMYTILCDEEIPEEQLMTISNVVLAVLKRITANTGG
jgi:hypothetical protein